VPHLPFYPVEKGFPMYLTHSNLTDIPDNHRNVELQNHLVQQFDSLTCKNTNKSLFFPMRGIFHVSPTCFYGNQSSSYPTAVGKKGQKVISVKKTNTKKINTGLPH